MKRDVRKKIAAAAPEAIDLIGEDTSADLRTFAYTLRKVQTPLVQIFQEYIDSLEGLCFDSLKSARKFSAEVSTIASRLGMRFATRDGHAALLYSVLAGGPPSRPQFVLRYSINGKLRTCSVGRRLQKLRLVPTDPLVRKIDF